MDPKMSWVSRWNGLKGFIPGIYAIRILNNQDDEDNE